MAKEMAARTRKSYHPTKFVLVVTQVSQIYTNCLFLLLFGMYFFYLAFLGIIKSVIICEIRV